MFTSCFTMGKSCKIRECSENVGPNSATAVVLNPLNMPSPEKGGERPCHTHDLDCKDLHQTGSYLEVEESIGGRVDLKVNRTPKK